MAISLAPWSAAADYRLKVLHDFCRSGLNKCGGEYPHGALIMDAAGNLYGTTEGGGTRRGAGVAFELSPGDTRASEWEKTVLYRFCLRDASHGDCADGKFRTGGLIVDKAGNLYGTTGFGGNESHSGVVFELTPPIVGGDPWSETLLYTFCEQSRCYLSYARDLNHSCSGPKPEHLTPKSYFMTSSTEM
jgi:hypothetical protein